MRELFLIALVLACPLMMLWMMRGGHGGHGGHGSHGGHGGGCGHGHGDTSSGSSSTVGLRRERAELDRLLEERESEEETPTAAGGWQ